MSLQQNVFPFSVILTWRDYKQTCVSLIIISTKPVSPIPLRIFKLIVKIKELPQSIPVEAVFQLKESENLVFVTLSKLQNFISGMSLNVQAKLICENKSNPVMIFLTL